MSRTVIATTLPISLSLGKNREFKQTEAEQSRKQEALPANIFIWELFSLTEKEDFPSRETEPEWMGIWVPLKFLNFCPVVYSSILRALIDKHFIFCFCLLRRLLGGVLWPNSCNQVRGCHSHQESGELMRWRLRGSRRVLGTRLGEQQPQRAPCGYCRCEGRHLRQKRSDFLFDAVSN